jgi:hypothetical protein
MVFTTRCLCSSVTFSVLQSHLRIHLPFLFAGIAMTPASFTLCANIWRRILVISAVVSTGFVQNRGGQLDEWLESHFRRRCRQEPWLYASSDTYGSNTMSTQRGSPAALWRSVCKSSTPIAVPLSAFLCGLFATKVLVILWDFLYVSLTFKCFTGVCHIAY